jgi:Questin oxidase-like
LSGQPNHKLRERLLQAAHWDAEYGPSLSSHLPMTLTALTRLGASDARVTAFAKTYAMRLHAAPPMVPWPAGDAWPGLLGRPSAWPMYRSFWRDWLPDEGATDVLAQALPTLMQGVGAAAFHGLLRVAYAITANHVDELADALAYWSCRWFACGQAGLAPQSARQESTATVLRRMNFQTELNDAPLIAEVMLHAAVHPNFVPAIAPWRVDLQATLPELATLAAKYYVRSADFTVLHLVTSAHAMLVVLPWLRDASRLAALQHYAAAAAAAWATVPAPPKQPTKLTHSVKAMPWPRVIQQAVQQANDHTIKLVDSCRELERLLGGDVWLRAATRAVTPA